MLNRLRAILFVAAVPAFWLAGPADSEQALAKDRCSPQGGWGSRNATPTGETWHYVAPRPTPAHVGHTYITYEPFMPHEFLYRHHRTYHRDHGGGSRTTTRVRWW
jgi:hypothetical protein